MREKCSESRWSDHSHKSFMKSMEHSDLLNMELVTGHVWKRTDSGEIKYYPLEDRCQGPVCQECGFSFCVECRLPIDLCACVHAPVISSGPIPKVEMPQSRAYLMLAATTLISSSLRRDREKEAQPVDLG